MKKVLCVFLTVLCVFSAASCKKEPLPVNVTPEPDNADNESGIVWLITPEKTYEDVQAMEFYCDTTKPHAQYLTFQQDGKWGVINDKLETILAANSTVPAFFCSMGHMHIETAGSLNPVTLENGIEVINGGHGALTFEVVCNVNDGLIYGVMMSEDGADAVLLSESTAVLPDVIPFSYVNLFYDDMQMSYSFESEFRYGYCDRAGNILTKNNYDYAQSFYDGVAAVMQDGKWGYIDRNFQQITDLKYQPCFGSVYYKNGYQSSFFAFSMCDGYVPVMVNAKYGVIDKNGEEVLPCSYDKILPLTGGRALIQYEGKWGIADLK